MRRRRRCQTAAEVEPYVHSTGFFSQTRPKTSLAGSRLLIEHHGRGGAAAHGRPLELPVWPGKTANVVLALPSGINGPRRHCRHPCAAAEATGLGLSKQERSARIETGLIWSCCPSRFWEKTFSIRMIFHGRAVSTPAKPACDGCPLADLCPSQSDPARPR